MKIRIALATIAGCMALAACGAGNDEANTLNVDDNLMTDMNAGMTDMNAGMTDMNSTTDMNGMDMNATTNTDTTNTTNTL
jgi:hypothetical protein